MNGWELMIITFIIYVIIGTVILIFHGKKKNKEHSFNYIGDDEQNEVVY